MGLLGGGENQAVADTWKALSSAEGLKGQDALSKPICQGLMDSHWPSMSISKCRVFLHTILTTQ